MPHLRSHHRKSPVLNSRRNSSNAHANCTISNNTADTDGAGIYCKYHSSPTITNCVIDGNITQYSSDGGGGIYCHVYSSPTVANCTIANNSTDRCGGGVYCGYHSDPTITNCTISYNTAGDHGGGVYCDYGSPTLTNCILWGDSPQEVYVDSSSPVITYTNIQGGWAGEGNIDSGPLFVDPDGGDFHLSAESPCVNRGNNHAPGLPDADFDGDPRIRHCRVDMGADESPYFLDCNENGAADACDIEDGTSTDLNRSGIPDECECPANTVFTATPPSGAVDARKPHRQDSETPLYGFGMPDDPASAEDESVANAIVLDLGVTGAPAECFVLCETPVPAEHNAVEEVVDHGDGSYTIELAHGAAAGHVTTIQYAGSADYIEYVHHPGNVDGSSAANANDIVELLECLDDPDQCELWETDMDCSGISDTDDLTQLTDVLNGAGAYEPWFHTPRPVNDGSCP